MKLFTFLLFTFALFISCKRENISLYNQWQLTSYIKGPGEIVKNSGFNLKIQFFRDKSFGAYLNTHDCYGEFTKEASKLNVYKLTCDSLSFDSSLTKEALYLIIDSAETYNINGNTLELEGGDFTKIKFQLTD